MRRPGLDFCAGQGRVEDASAAVVQGRVDDANGVDAKLDIGKWTFMNTDLVVHVHRMPAGEWIGVCADSSYGPDGIGATVGTLFDERGPVGSIQQGLLVRPLPPRDT